MSQVAIASIANVFPVGTTVNAYPASAFAMNWVAGTAPPSGAVSAASGVVGSDGSLDLAGLGEGVRYKLYALVGSDHRYVTVSAISATEDTATESVLDYGATGDGVTDDTAAFVAAVAAAVLSGREVLVDPGTYIVSSLTLASSVKFRGVGDASIIKQKAGTNAHLFVSTASGLVLTFEDLLIDGNQVNQTNDSTHVYHAIHVDADAAAAASPERLEVRNVTFRNARSGEIFLRKGTALTATSQFEVEVDGCQFFGGAESTATFDSTMIQVTGPVALRVHDCECDLQRAPTVGRAGITVDSATNYAQLAVTDNRFIDIGLSRANSLGVIDGYSGAGDVVIADNQIVRPFGRGINIKSDDSNVTITGNVIDGLTGPVIGEQIVVNRMVHNAVTGRVVIDGNTCLNSGNDSISVSGGSTLGAGNAKDYVISNNVLVGATRRGLGLIGVGNIAVVGNVISNAGADAIYASGCVGVLQISDNELNNPVVNGIELDATNTGPLNIVGNTVNTPGSRGMYIASGAGGKITGNLMIGCGNHALQVLGTTAALVITENVALGGTTTFNDGGGNTALTVRDNTFSNVTDAAGGELAGSYPNPTLADATVRAVRERARRLPTGVIWETITRSQISSSAITMGASGVLVVVSADLLAGDLVSALRWYLGSTAPVGITNQWACLMDENRVVRAVSADKTNEAWSAVTATVSSGKTFAMGAAYTIPTSGRYLLGLLIAVSTTMPTLAGCAAGGGIVFETPTLAAKSSTGLTGPPSVGDTMGALAAGISGIPYVAVS